jgi:hypothetical protein
MNFSEWTRTVWRAYSFENRGHFCLWDISTAATSTITLPETANLLISPQSANNAAKYVAPLPRATDNNPGPQTRYAEKSACEDRNPSPPQTQSSAPAPYETPLPTRPHRPIAPPDESPPEPSTSHYETSPAPAPAVPSAPPAPSFQAPPPLAANL